MNDNKGVKLSNNRIYLSEFGLVIILSSLFLFFMLVGSFSVSLCKNNSCYGVDSVINSIVNSRKTSTFWQTLLLSFLSSIIWLVVGYFCGASSFGFVVCFLLLSFRGFALGITAGFLYSTKGLFGIGFFLLVLFFGLFISNLTLIFAYSNSITLSLHYLHLLKGTNDANKTKEKMIIFSKKYIIYLSLIVISSVIDAVMSLSFSGYFNF